MPYLADITEKQIDDALTRVLQKASGAVDIILWRFAAECALERRNSPSTEIKVFLHHDPAIGFEKVYRGAIRGLTKKWKKAINPIYIRAAEFLAWANKHFPPMINEASAVIKRIAAHQERNPQ